MGKRGFTLIELLAVIFMLGVILTIAVPSISGVTNMIQKNMLDEKIKLIEEGAVLYGEDEKDSIVESESSYNGNPCKSIIVSNLVPNYLEKDNNNECLTSSEGINGCIIDPSDKENFLDTLEVIIYYQNKRVRAVVDVNNEYTCN